MHPRSLGRNQSRGRLLRVRVFGGGETARFGSIGNKPRGRSQGATSRRPCRSRAWPPVDPTLPAAIIGGHHEHRGGSQARVRRSSCLDRRGRLPAGRSGYDYPHHGPRGQSALGLRTGDIVSPCSPPLPSPCALPSTCGGRLLEPLLIALVRGVTGRLVVRIRCGRRAVEKPDHRHRRLLRPRRKRPCGRRAAEKGDEVAPSQSSELHSSPPAGAGLQIPAMVGRRVYEPVRASASTVPPTRSTSPFQVTEPAARSAILPTWRSVSLVNDSEY
jgi:hypothetical protein